MLRAMHTAATGMRAQEMRIDATSNNLANVNTTGFKKERVEFQDLLYEQLRPATGPGPNGTQSPTALEVGLGVKPVATLRQFSMGDLKQTGNALDLAIEGDGFFRIQRPNGEPAYTRAGTFRTDATGQIVTADGHPLDPSLVIPEDARDIAIAPDGRVSAVRAGQVDAVEVGRIELATFVNAAGLRALGNNLFEETEASGRAVIAEPGSSGTGMLGQGMLEMSNVRVVEEMVDLITTQRAYETNSKVIQTADEMMRSTSNLR